MSTATKTIQVQLPDGSERTLPAGTTPFDIASSISPRLAAAAIAAQITPLHAEAAAKDSSDAHSEASMYAAEDAHATRTIDLSQPLDADVSLRLLTERDEESLRVVRHSAAHVMATAVLELFPETKLGHGPV